MTVSRAVWEPLGFASADDFELLERATGCKRCGAHLAPTARYRLRNTDGTWSTDVVCPPCHAALLDRLGYADDGHQEVLLESLF